MSVTVVGTNRRVRFHYLGRMTRRTVARPKTQDGTVDLTLTLTLPGLVDSRRSTCCRCGLRRLRLPVSGDVSKLLRLYYEGGRLSGGSEWRAVTGLIWCRPCPGLHLSRWAGRLRVSLAGLVSAAWEALLGEKSRCTEPPLLLHAGRITPCLLLSHRLKT